MQHAAIPRRGLAVLLAAALLSGCIGGGGPRSDPRFAVTQGLDTLSDGPDAIPRYCDILAGMRPDRLAPRDHVIRAVFYYRFHRMHALEVLHSMPLEQQQRCRPLIEIETRHGRDADFLSLAFAEAVLVAAGGGVDPSQIPPWVVEERERIFGDYFRSRAEVGVLDTAAYAERAPAGLVRELERMTYLEIAMAYQGSAWQKAIQLGRPQDAPRAQLIGSCEAMAKCAEALAQLPDRVPEFSADHTILARSFRSMAQKLLVATGSGDAGVPRLSDFGNFDRQYQFREGRQRVAMAVTEMNAGKSPRACRFLLDALKHLLFAQELAGTDRLTHPQDEFHEDENVRTSEDYLAAIFGSYQRLTSAVP